MPRIAVSTLARSLRSGPAAPAYYVHGDEAILRSEAVAMLLDAVLEPATRDFNLDILSAQQLDPAELAGACSTMPMMAAHRVVLLRDIEAWKRKSKGKQPAIEYLERPSPDTVLIMVQGQSDEPDTELASRATEVVCDTLTGKHFDDWLAQRLQARGVTLTDAGRDHLIKATAGDHGLLASEIDKLSGLASGQAIDEHTVSAMVGVRYGETVEDWRDAVLSDDTALAIRVLPRLLETSGVSGVRLVSQLGSSLLVLQWARGMLDARTVQQSRLAQAIKNDLLFKVRPQVGSYDPLARLIARVVNRWSGERLDRALRLTLEADIALKTTTISDETGIMTSLVLALAEPGSGRKAA